MSPPPSASPLAGATWPLVPVWGLWALLVLGMFSPALVPGWVPAFGDAMHQDLPLRVLAAEALRAGELPFWNPWSFAGQPLLATMHVGVGFPLNWGFLFLPAPWALAAATIGGVWLAGAGMVWLARAHGCGRGAALLAAGVFGASGFVVAHLENVQMLHGAALLPWVLAALHRLAATGAWRHLVAGAAALALTVLAGHPHMVVFPLPLVVAYAGVLGWLGPAGGRGRFGGAVVGMLLAGAGLGAVQLLPMLAWVPETQRLAAAAPDATDVTASLPPYKLATLWVPALFGGWPSALVPSVHWGGPSRVESQIYAGLATLVLAAAALLPGARHRLATFWGGAACLAVVLLLGNHTPINWLLIQVPLYRPIAYSVRHALELSVCLAMLAALGLPRLAALSRAHRAWLAALVLAPAPVAWLGIAGLGEAYAARLGPHLPAAANLGAFWRPGQPALWLPALLALALVAGLSLTRRPALVVAWVGSWLAVDLALYGEIVAWRARSLAPVSLPAPRPLQGLGVDRVLALYPDPIYPYDDPATVAVLRLPNWGAGVGVRHVGGYDAFIDRRYAAMLGGMYAFGGLVSLAPLGPRHHGLDLLACRYVLLDARLARDPAYQAALAPPRWVARGEEPGVRLFENRRALPRAWRVTRARVVAERALPAHLAGEAPFEPRLEALLTTPLPAHEAWTAGPARLLQEAGNGLVVETAGSGPGLVVVSVRHTPGWRVASPPGVTLTTVDGALLGVVVPAGRHRVALTYEAPGWRAGLATSTGTALGLGALGWLRRRRTAGPPGSSAAPPGTPAGA
ncbi:MAG: hypothetical protein VKQ33_06720 [Candidatus Sericytochromatia bacterium]|nr:hypothetical protein [Candidatus Sericytochromatia bacterium]